MRNTIKGNKGKERRAALQSACGSVGHLPDYDLFLFPVQDDMAF